MALVYIFLIVAVWHATVLPCPGCHKLVLQTETPLLQDWLSIVVFSFQLFLLVVLVTLILRWAPLLVIVVFPAHRRLPLL